mgnify:FL=1
MSAAKEWLRAFASLLFPERCPLCDEITVGGSLCARCEADPPPAGGVRSLPETEHCVCVAPYRYEGRVRESLHRFKFRGRREYASFFGHALAEELRPYAGNAFLVPVPVSRRRERERGYNQSLLLARAASRELHIPCLDLLCKTRENETQHELGRAAREQNVRNVYAVKPGKRLPGRAIVVDDIVSTGHTLAACVSALRKAGIEVCCCAAVADNSLSNVELPAKP